MSHILHLIARRIEVLLGVFCVLTAIVLYPGQEGKIQSGLGDFYRSTTSEPSSVILVPAGPRNIPRTVQELSILFSAHL
jgi:hypothetical protein